MATLCVMPPMLDMETAYQLSGFFRWLTIGLRRLIIQSAKDPFWGFDTVIDAFEFAQFFMSQDG